MNKGILFRFATLFLLFVSFAATFRAAEQFSEFIRLGHAAEMLGGYDNSPNPEQDPELKRAVAIYIPASQMIPCKGNYISKIKFAVAQSIYWGEKGIKIFVTKNLSETYDYEQPVTDIVSMWNQVELTTPFLIDGDSVYIGYEYYATNKNNISRLTDEQDTSRDWCYLNGEWVKSQNSSALAIQGIVEGEQLPKYNITLKSTDVLPYAELGKNASISGEFVNMGTATLTGFDVRYRLNGGEWIAETVSNVNIPYESSYTFRTNHLTFPDTGEYTVEISVDKLNGHDDTASYDNLSSVYTVGCVNDFTARNVLLEIFSTERCPNCPAGHKHLQAIVNHHPNVLMVGHHSGYGTDDYTIQPSIDYEWFYNTSLSAPSIMLDRRNQFRYNKQLPDFSPVFSAGSLTTDLLENALEIPAFATVDLRTKYEETTRKATIHVEGKRLLPLEGNDSRLFVYITEDNIYTNTQSGADKEVYYHQHTLRQVLTDTWGDPINLDKGYSADYHATIPDTQKSSEMHVIAFVANYNSQDVNNCTVYNAAQVKLDGNESSISQHRTLPVAFTTKQKTICIEGEYDSFKLYELTGKCLKQGTYPTCEIPVETSGVYLIELRQQRITRTYKIILTE